LVTILLAVLAAVANAGASVLQRKANLREVQARRSGVAALRDLLRQPLWFAGIGAVIASFLLQAGALATGDLSEVQPILSLELPLTLVLASLTFERRLGRRAWGEIGVLTCGIALFLFALSPTEGSPGATAGWAWVWSAGSTAGVVALLAAAAALSSGLRRAALLGVASGISFALTAAFISAALARGLSWSLFARWQLYLVAVCGVAAMVLLQEAMQAGSLVAVQPGVTLSDPVVAVVLGVLLFHEGVRTGWWIIVEGGGAVAVAWGAVRLSRSPVTQVAQEQAPPERSSTARPPSGLAAGHDEPRRG
jgi:drug/metabolite transporter (DMT)-like permease